MVCCVEMPNRLSDLVAVSETTTWNTGIPSEHQFKSQLVDFFFFLNFIVFYDIVS